MAALTDSNPAQEISFFLRGVVCGFFGEVLNYEIGPQVRAIVYADLLKPEKVRGLGHEQGCKSNKNGDFVGFITNKMGVSEDRVYLVN